MDYEEIEKEMCNFKIYLKQTNDLLNDSYRWKVMAKHCNKEEHKEKYMRVSNTLYELFMEEHNSLGNMFKS